MKKSTIVALGLAIFATLPAVASSPSPLRIAKHMRTEEKQQKGSSVQMKVSELAGKFKPSVTKTYGWNGKRWMLDDEITYTYDSKGNAIRELSIDGEGDYVNTVCEFNEHGKVTYKESQVSSDGVNYSNYKKTEFEYDPILTNVITKRTEWLWMNNDWMLVGNNYERRITRDDDGNITSVVIAVLFQGYYDPTQRVTIEYGEDGKAVSISEEILGYNGKDYYWQQGTKITDIKWERTDGQIYDPELLFLGNNRILSAHYEEEDDFGFDMTVEYAEESEAYTVRITTEMEGMPMEAITEYTPLENDGYILTGTTYFLGMPLYSSKEEERYDDWGLMLLSSQTETEEGEEYVERVVGEVEYDQAGMPSTYTLSEEYPDSSTSEMVSEYVLRAEYFDYIEVSTSVADVDIEVVGALKYYDLSGLPVECPAAGTVVVKKERNKVSKLRIN